MPRHSVLVVDDDALMRDYVCEALTRAGHDVRSVSGGGQAVNELKLTAYDVIVTDLKMAPMDGLEVLRLAKKECPGAHCIVMTAYGTIETAVAALKSGAEDYILKPFAPDELELAVARALERGKMAQENRYLREELNAIYDFQSMVGDSEAMRVVYDQVRKVTAGRRY
jgi:DNA-binding NtrC family response regulator